MTRFVNIFGDSEDLKIVTRIAQEAFIGLRKELRQINVRGSGAEVIYNPFYETRAWSFLIDVYSEQCSIVNAERTDIVLVGVPLPSWTITGKLKECERVFAFNAFRTFNNFNFFVCPSQDWSSRTRSVHDLLTKEDISYSILFSDDSSAAKQVVRIIASFSQPSAWQKGIMERNLTETRRKFLIPSLHVVHDIVEILQTKKGSSHVIILYKIGEEWYVEKVHEVHLPI